MAFTKNDERMNQGGGGGGINKPGIYQLRITAAAEAMSRGVMRLEITAADDSGQTIRGWFDLEGDFAWRADRLMHAIGRDGYADPAEIIGTRFEAEIVPQKRDPQYMEIRRVSPAQNRPDTRPTDDEIPF